MSASEAVVRFEAVSKAFGQTKVLDQASFDVAGGTATCILGRSGTGKSVTLKLMIGLMKPDGGTITINGQDIGTTDARTLAGVRRAVGFMFQNGALFDSMSVGQNIGFPLKRHTDHSDAKIREHVERQLAEVGLEDQYDKMPSELSGGMRKRVALARALVFEPSVVLVDEPSAGLDPITSTEIDNLLLRLKSDAGVTLVVVTHNIASARRIADQNIMLGQGRIVARGTMCELEESDDELVRRFLGSGEGHSG